MNWYPIPPLIGAICVLMIGVFVYSKNRSSIINISFSLFCLFLFVWLISYSLSYLISNVSISAVLCRFACTSVNFLFPTLYLFAAAYLNKIKEEKIWIYVFYAIVIILTPFFIFTKLFLIGTYKYYWGYYSRSGPLHPYAVVISIIIWIKGLSLFFDKEEWLKFSDVEKNKAKYVFAVYIISSLGSLDYIQKYGVEIYPLGWLFAVLFATVSAYAIIRHQLMDIRVAIKRTIVFTLLFVAIYAVLASFTLLMQSGVEKILSTHKFTIASTEPTGSWPSITLFGLKVNIFSIPPFILSLLTLIYGLFVYSKNTKESQNKAYLRFALSLFLWLFFASLAFSARDEKQAIFFCKMVFLGVTFIPITMYDFVAAFLDLKNKNTSIRYLYFIGTLMVVILFSTSLYISDARRFFWGYYPKAGPFHMLDVALFVSLYSYLLFLLYKGMKNYTYSANKRMQIKYVLIAFLVALFAGMDFIPNYGYEIYPFGYLLIFIMFCIISYAIVRHRLLDIEVVVRKTLIFGGLFTVVYAVFGFFALLGQTFFEKFVTQNRWISIIPSVLVVTVMLRPLENFLIGITDRYLFQKKYDYRELIKVFTSEVLTVLELDKLIRLTKERLAEIMKLKSCDIALGGTAEEAELKLPIDVDNKVIGTLLLGKKKSDEAYTQEDIDILQPLTRTLGIAISNAKLFDELVKAQAEVAQKDKMATIGTLAAGMAHEIRNPITTIRNFADYLPERRGDSAFMEKFNKLIPREIDRVEGIARSLLEFSAAEDTDGSEEFAIDEPMRTVIDLLEPQYRTSEIKIVCDHKDRYVIKGSRIQMQDAFFNIMNYALAEMQKGGKISIECLSSEGRMGLSIRAEDLFVADHVIKDVFEPVSGMYKEKRGFGFNLFVAKQLLEKNNAALKIISDKAKGSEFRIEFTNR